MNDPTQRFSSRVENYIKYRPSYPPEVMTLLTDMCGLTRETLVADIGAGTGMLTEQFLKRGNIVYAIEPNEAMRSAARILLHGYPRFQGRAGRAGATTLPSQSVDLVTVAQAFHWFDRERARREFIRILKPGGWVALMWNDRRTTTTPFLVAYEEFLRTHVTDYTSVDHKKMNAESVRDFFGAREVGCQSFDNQQVFDLAGLRGRALSSSYVPEEKDPRCKLMLAQLDQLFAAHAVAGRVTFEYDTTVYYGQLS